MPSNEYKIRSITLHDPRGVDSLGIGELESITARLREVVDEVMSGSGVEIESARLVVEAGRIGDLEGLAGKLGELADEYQVLLSVGGIPSSVLDESKVALRSLLENGIFFHVQVEEYSWDEARKISGFIHEMADIDPVLATRFGVNVYTSPVITPYYPLASPLTGEGAATVSLTYPNYLLNAYRRGGYNGLVEAVVSAGEKALEVLEEASRLLGVKPLGVDLSVAPWMEESTLGLVEYVVGVRMPEPGFLQGIYIVNRALQDASRVLGKTVGFNEVQLPVAEDLKLKARVSELNTKARDLARFSCLCLAGLDLAVVPASRDAVAGLILDVGACSRAKDKPLGVRIIPLEDVEPGDKVWLGKFGDAPVIPI
ncbi:MAG: DUF711 family protein [Desulfurococcales archaeon]|nr:DUF711 family protein [Desulfurococcales archaeon]